MTGIATKGIHGADEHHRVSDVTPPINISTTFRYDKDPEKLRKLTPNDILEPLDDDVPVYLRLSHPNGILVEKTVGKITDSYAAAYSSGLGAFFAALTHFNPKVLCIGKGYHGCHGIADILTRNYGLKQYSLSDEDLENLGEGDVLHLETPVNPESYCYDISYYAEKAHSKGAFLLIDATFAPPPLLDPFEFGADMVMHSATKYFGGHSDLLAGLLLTKSKEVHDHLIQDRIFLGTNIANLESALLVRSLKTLELRVNRQSENATKLVKFLEENKSKFPALAKVHHSSLQKDAFVAKQMKGGHSPTFSIETSTEDIAKRLPSKLKLFYHATSLGGAESLIEWRAMSDNAVSPSLLRVSVGLENIEDLIDDFAQALLSSV